KPLASWLTAGLNGLNWHGQVCPPTLAIVTVPPCLCSPPPVPPLLVEDDGLDELVALPIGFSPPPPPAAARPPAPTAAAPRRLMPLIDFCLSLLEILLMRMLPHRGRPPPPRRQGRALRSAVRPKETGPPTAPGETGRLRRGRGAGRVRAGPRSGPGRRRPRSG